MDLLLSAWILFWDVIIVTITVSITHYKLKKAEREALKERDAIEAKFIQSAKDMQLAIEAKIDAIEIPEPDTESIKADLKESLAQSLNAHVTALKKQVNDLADKIDKAITQSQSGSAGSTPDVGDKLLLKLIDRFA